VDGNIQDHTSTCGRRDGWMNGTIERSELGSSVKTQGHWRVGMSLEQKEERKQEEGC